jgi:hypothetical protein
MSQLPVRARLRVLATITSWYRAPLDLLGGGADPAANGKWCPVRLERWLVVEGAAGAGESVQDLLGALVPADGSGVVVPRLVPLQATFALLGSAA